MTAEWDSHGVKRGLEYAILTDEITKAWAGITTRQYKNLKGLKKENFRDNMSDLELVLTMLAEATTMELSKVHNPQSFRENKAAAQRGGKVAGDARKSIEADTGRFVLTEKTAQGFRNLISDIITNTLPSGDDEEKKSFPLFVSSAQITRKSAVEYYANDGSGVIYNTVAEQFETIDIKVIGASPMYFGSVLLGEDIGDHATDPTAEKGLKVCSPSVKMWEALAFTYGFIPIPLAAADTFVSMQSGGVEGMFGGGS